MAQKHFCYWVWVKSILKRPKTFSKRNKKVTTTKNEKTRCCLEIHGFNLLNTAGMADSHSGS